MHIAEIKADDSGEIATGYFYRVDPWPIDKPPRVEGIIFSDAPPNASPIYLDFDDEKYTGVFECPADKAHETGSHLDRLEVMSLGGQHTPLAKSMAWYHIIIRDDVLKSLGEAGLKGLRAVRCDALNDEGKKIDIPYFALAFDGKSISRVPIVIPSNANQCPFCGHGPVVCPKCGSIVWDICPNCKKRCIMSKGDVGDPELRAPILRLPVPDEGHIVDASHWDGTDFLCGPRAVTRRVVSALLKLHVFAFRAIPLRTYLGSCTPSQRTVLENLKNV